MSPSVNLYNKYRPRRFADVKQEHVVRVFRAQVARGEFASTYLLSGSAGTGKTTLARVMASALLCSDRGESVEPCGKCQNCEMVITSSHRDVKEINCADNNGVDDVREMIAGAVRLAPSYGKFRVFILDEAQELTRQAQSALLKVLEEPPPYCKFFLCTTDAPKISHAIRTRCQHHHLSKVSPADNIDILNGVVAAEGYEADQNGLALIVDAAEGSARDALTLLEQVGLIGATEENVRAVLRRAPRQLALDMLATVFMYKRPKLFRLIDVAAKEGRDLGALLEEMAEIVMEATKHRLYRTSSDQLDPSLVPYISGYTNDKGEVYPALTPMQVVLITKSLLDIQKSIRQNVPAELIVKAGLLEIIDRFAKLRESVAKAAS